MRFLAVIAACVLSLPVGAQSVRQPDTLSGLTTVLAQGWSALARGNLPEATTSVDKALSQSPNSAAAVALAVEVGIARGGALAGLDSYEKWLDRKRLDDPYALRRIGVAYLLEQGRQRRNPAARTAALEALVADGDAEAGEQLTRAAMEGGVAETRALASVGNPQAVQLLLTQLGSRPDRVGSIEALAESGSGEAVQPLVAMLTDPHDEYRAAATEALGKLGAHQAIDQIKPLLNDVSFAVRLAAAGALYRLDDNSGAPLLDQLLGSEHPAIRLGAAEALSVRPGGAWQSVVRDLTGDDDELVRLKAAHLIAPYDRELAESVLQGLQQSENLAIRERAVETLVHDVANDFATLRRLMRSADPVTGSQAAGRILELTRQ